MNRLFSFALIPCYDNFVVVVCFFFPQSFHIDSFEDKDVDFEKRSCIKV